jgi:hypothetical protein
MSGEPAYSSGYGRSPPPRPAGATETERKRSNAAIPVVVVLAAIGLYFGQYTIFAPGILGLVLVYTGFSFLSTRLNPLSAHFYLSKKPSWLAVGVVWLGAVVLLWDTYLLLTRDLAGYGLHL